jgi:hypothetical protein
MPPKRGSYRFSDHFRLGMSQSQLDFVDIPLDTDVSLYVDPFALSVSGSDWLRECGSIVVSFFDYFLSVIKAGDESAAMKVIANLHEPNDTHLGVSKGAPAGRGWGKKQGKMLYERLRRSNAVKSGKLKDLSDVELFIPGIGSDKISDLTINVLRGEFVAYTEEQCELFGIPTEQINCGMFWNYDANIWETRYANLPTYKNERIVLVPKIAVRVRLVPDHEEFYKKFVLDYLGAEHLSANDSLVTLLKNGSTKVYKKDLKNKYKLSKEFLFEFAEQHPRVLRKYKKFMRNKIAPIVDSTIEDYQRMPRKVDLPSKGELSAIPTGAAHATTYHNFILGALSSIFSPSLSRPVKEQPINDGRKRLDIVFSNSSESGFFSRLTSIHKVHCPLVHVECKNYKEDPANPELDQLQGRFSRRRGHFGILVCRNIDNPDLMLKRLRDIVLSSDGVVIVLDDADISHLLDLRAEENILGINEYLESKLIPLLM